MAKYQVVQKSFIDGVFYNPDEPRDKDKGFDVVEFSGVPGPNLKPLDDAGKKEQAKFKEVAAKDAKKLAKAADGVEDAAELAAA